MPPSKPRTAYRCEICSREQSSFSMLGHIRLFVAPCRLQDNSYTYEANACGQCRRQLKRAFQKEIDLIDDDI